MVVAGIGGAVGGNDDYPLKRHGATPLDQCAEVTVHLGRVGARGPGVRRTRAAGLKPR